MMTKEKMVEVLHKTGLTEEQMQRFHREFEKLYPADHQAFLAWLQIPAAECEKIRQASR